MKVILKEDVKSLGVYGDEVEVAGGFGRNFLLPKGFAVQATEKNRSVIKRQKKIVLIKLEKNKAGAESLVNQILAVDFLFKRKCGEREKLFGSVTSQDIAEFLSEKGFSIDKRKIELEEPIKNIGSFQVSIKIHPDVPCAITVTVEKEG